MGTQAKTFLYRGLHPPGLEPILVVGKAYSTNHHALSGGRMQPDSEHLVLEMLVDRNSRRFRYVLIPAASS